MLWMYSNGTYDVPRVMFTSSLKDDRKTQLYIAQEAKQGFKGILKK